MSTNPDDAVGMADEPDQPQGDQERTEQDAYEGSGGVPNPDTGAGLGAGEPNTFEPEEDPEAQ